MPLVSAKSLKQLYSTVEVPGHDTELKSYDRRIEHAFGRHKHKHWWNRRGSRSIARSKPVKRDIKLEPVPFYKLFRFLTCKDGLLLAVGFTAALGASSCDPALNLLFAKMSGLLVDAKNMHHQDAIYCNGSTQIFPNSSDSKLMRPLDKKIDLMHQMGKYSLYMCALGVFNLVCSYFFISMFNRVGENQVYRLRIRYFSALLQQNIGWYDTVEDRNFIARISENISKIQEAISEKVGMCFYNVFIGVLSLAAALYYGWLMSLVMLSLAPVIIAAMIIVARVQGRLALKEQAAYAKAGTVAQEALGNIRTVMAFSGQTKEIERFEDTLKYAKRAGRVKGLFSAFGSGFLWFLNYCTFSLGFWYGSRLVFQDNPCKTESHGNYGPAEMILVFFEVMSAAFNVGHALSYTEVFATGCGAAAAVYKVIDRVPEIDSFSTHGMTPNERSKGKIEFKNVSFSYPSRKDVKILNRLNLAIEPGTTVALVGNSGCGKSTCLQLIQRFYDPDNGSIAIDGVSLKDLNISWCRSQLGVVSQEPVLFNATIAENIRYGKSGATQQEIEEACKLSNAHSFITKMPKKYETRVGERGAQLSGGQKQRIAIARALIRNPSILLMDEATSALDTQSEAVVQEALEKASVGRTTIIVAHRLSTIRNADVIVSLQNGMVQETGTHESLLAQKGLYYKLVTAQVGDDSDEQVGDGEDLQSKQEKFLEPTEDEETGEVGPYHAEETLELARRTSFIKLLKLNSKEWYWITGGIIMALFQGLILPAYAYFYGQFTGVFSEKNKTKAQNKANQYALIFLYIGVYAGTTVCVGLGFFALAGEALTNRLRKLSFITMMKQDLGWYDDPTNSVGGLCTRLSGDAASVQGATGMRMGMVTQAAVTIILSLALGLYVMPKLGVVVVAFMPVILITSYYHVKLLENQQIEEKIAIEEASSFAFQAVSGIRTVQCLCREEMFVEMYSKALLPPHKKALRNTHLLGFVNGLALSLCCFAYAVIYYYGAYLFLHEGAEYQDIITLGESLVWTMMTLGQTLTYAPNYGKAKVAGGRIMNLLEHQSKIDSSSDAGTKITTCDGHINFKNVHFSYPTRKDVKILRGLSIDFEPYKHVGICGPSGSGKSTCIQLLLRYYDPSSGRVLLDGTDISTLNLPSYRSQLAIVSQEPSLFDRTIAENIAYGDNSRDVTMEEIIQAAKSANIHSFITSLPDGYSTKVGDFVTHLSGGQKQRVAIARALVRNPKVLLLDEATSALDAESERVVQAALENVTAGRTCISIAHRLSSIQNADRILVIKSGALVESGTHSQLLQQKGVYHTLYSLQSHSFSS